MNPADDYFFVLQKTNSGNISKKGATAHNRAISYFGTTIQFIYEFLTDCYLFADDRILHLSELKLFAEGKLTHYHIIPIFNTSGKESFRKHCGKRIKCW